MSLHLLLSNYYRLQQVEADVCKSELTIEKVKTIHRFHKLAFDRGDSSLEDLCCICFQPDIIGQM